MEIRIDERDGCCRMHIAGELVAAATHTVREAILSVVSRCERVEIDLSGVSRIDPAGLDLMLLVKRAAGRRLNFIGHSQAILQVLDATSAAWCLPRADCRPGRLP